TRWKIAFCAVRCWLYSRSFSVKVNVNGTLFRECDVCGALVAGAHLLRAVPGVTCAGVEVLSGNISFAANRLRTQRVGPDSGAARSGRYGVGGRPAGDGDDFRLREFCLTTGYR